MSETRKPKLTAGKSVNASAKVKVTEVKPVTTVKAKPAKKAVAEHPSATRTSAKKANAEHSAKTETPVNKAAKKAPAKKAVSKKAVAVETPVEAVSVGLWARFKAFFLGA